MKTSKYDTLHVFLFCFSALLIENIILDYIDEHQKQKKPACCVEVELGGEEIEPKPAAKTFTKLERRGKIMFLSRKEFLCLSKNIYWESKNESLIGQIAVANVTYNRVSSGRWGDTFCKVVYSPKQFSWTNDKKLLEIEPKGPKWKRAKHSAFLFTKGVRVANLDNTQFYYAQYIKKPRWANSMNKTAHIGQHIFYSKY